MNLAVFVMQDLIDYGEVIRGWLGSVVAATLGDARDGKRRALGAGGGGGQPALKAGLLPAT